MYHEPTQHSARGKWRGILLELGVPEKALTGKHTACPLCGGSDRFRFDDQDRRGTYICGQCGAGDGMKLAMEFTGQPFPDVARRIDQMLGNIKADGQPVASKLSEDDRRRLLRETYAASRPVTGGDLAHKYLASRYLQESFYPKALRFAPALRDGEGGLRPAMLACVGVYGAPKFVSIHRTFLKPDGSGKAEMASPRKMMPGDLPDGACVPLSEYMGGPLGIAEGIETAMGACALYSMPVWSAVNSAILKKWTPPEGCTEVIIFGDNDPKHGGQAAAYHLAHRLSLKGIDVEVRIPTTPGKDWADMWVERKQGQAK